MKVLENTFQDANFFKKCGLIDYSLIIIKVDWTKVVEKIIQFSVNKILIMQNY